MHSWNCDPYVIYEGHTVVGFLVAGGKDSFSELILTDASFAPKFVKAWCNVYEQNHLTITVPAIDRALNREIAAFAESYSNSNSEHVRIVNLINVLKACLSLKKKVSGISDGKIVLQIEDEAPVCAEVKNGEICVYETDEAADAKFDRLSMQQLLFAANRFQAPDCKLPVDWFPLPLFLYSSDHF